MYEAMLTLKPGVTLIKEGNQIGLMLNGQTQYAKNARQAEMIRSLSAHPLSPESLMALLCSRDGQSKSENDTSLTIAEFILDFGEFLEA